MIEPQYIMTQSLESRPLLPFSLPILSPFILTPTPFPYRFLLPLYPSLHPSIQFKPYSDLFPKRLQRSMILSLLFSSLLFSSLLSSSLLFSSLLFSSLLFSSLFFSFLLFSPLFSSFLLFPFLFSLSLLSSPFSPLLFLSSSLLSSPLLSSSLLFPPYPSLSLPPLSFPLSLSYLASPLLPI